MTQQTLEFAGERQPAQSVFGPAVPGLVFWGVQLEWNAKIADLEMITRVAQDWEPAFEHWSFADRTLHLGHGPLGYTVDLRDGGARILAQVPRFGVTIAQTHVAALIDILYSEGRTGIRISAEAQYLDPVKADSFEEVLRPMEARLLNCNFTERLGARVLDLAYLVDIEVEGLWLQVNIGPVRAHEIPRRVESTRLRPIPELARFFAVSGKDQVSSAEFDVGSFFSRIFRVGASILQELR